MNIIFIGCVTYSKEILNYLLENKVRIAGVISKDDTGFNSDYFDITNIAEHNEIPFIKTKNVNEVAVLSWVKRLNPDVVYCFGWNSLIGKDFLSIPPKGVIGYHPANLPQNRGRHPIIWALVLGLEKTASTFFQMGEGADDGDMVSQVLVDISKKDNADTLYEKLIKVSKIQVLDFTRALEGNTLIAKKQNNSQSNYWRKRTKLDGIIDFRMSSKSIYDLVRALTRPYPGAIIKFKEKEYTVWKTEINETEKINYEPGKILKIINNRLLVKCGQGTEAIFLVEHNLPENIQEGEYL